MRTHKYLLLGLVSLLGLSGCGNFTLGDAIQGAGKIKRYADAKNIEFSEADEFYLGRKVLATVMADREIIWDKRLGEYLNGVGQTLAASSLRPDIWQGYRFVPYKSNGLGAYCLPGGFILISTGLLQVLDNEDQLAAVLGHELGHARWRHPVEAIKKKMQTQAKQELALFFASRSGSDLVKVLSIVAHIGWENQLNNYSKEQELEADQYACWLMMKTGYNPNEMVKTLKKLPRGKQQYSKLHPPVAKRLATVRAEIARYKELPAKAAARAARYKAEVLNRLAALDSADTDIEGDYRDKDGNGDDGDKKDEGSDEG